MNFNQIRSVTQKDDKGYFVKLSMFGTLDSFEPVKFTENGSRFQQVMIIDDTGEQAKVKIWLGEDKTFGSEHIGQRLSFQIAKNPYKNKMYYSGFWDDRANVAPTRAAQNTSQPPQRGQTPSATTQTKKEPDWDAKDLRMARMNALTNATQLVKAIAEIMNDSSRIDRELVKRVAADYVDWIYEENQTETQTENQAEPEPDDIPF